MSLRCLANGMSPRGWLQTEKRAAIAQGSLVAAIGGGGGGAAAADVAAAAAAAVVAVAV